MGSELEVGKVTSAGDVVCTRGIVKKSTGSGNTEIKIENDSASNAAVLTLEGKRTSDNDCAQILIANSGENVAAIKGFRSGANDAGKLEIQTSASGSSGLATRLTIDSAGIITAASQVKVTSSSASTVAYSVGDAGTGWYNTGSNAIGLATNGVQRMNIANNGAVSIPGADAAASKLTVGDIHGELILNNTSGTSGSTVLSQTYNGSTAELRIGSNISGTGTSAMNISTGDAGIVTFNGGINLSSGNILIGKTVTADTETGSVLNATQMRQSAAGTVAHDFHDFYRGTAGSLARVGHIRTTGTATSYNTSSDYRLKENLEPLTGALDRLDALPVYRFNFKADPDTTVDGFVAHEVSAHVPEAVTGEKDAMRTVVVQEAVAAQPATYYEEGDELPEGKAVGDEKTPAVEAVEEVTEEQPDYQGIDQSKLVPLLVAAVKELKAKVEALEGGE